MSWQLPAGAAAARDLADQHQQLAARVAEGAGVVGELIGLVEVRDAQVRALQGASRGRWGAAGALKRGN